ncbi:hypothetical protein CFREI_11435 [Corynebacterium freiburgense]|nr:hypothetical protein CFREI_11435 [Corynebacterium freiburgense]
MICSLLVGDGFGAVVAGFDLGLWAGSWGLGLVFGRWFGCALVVSWDLVVYVRRPGSFGCWLGAGWACCHRFHFFGGFYGICDTIGREPVTNSIFFADFMESATVGMKTSLVQ